MELTALFTPLSDFLKWLAGERAARRERQDRALIALSEALFETQSYMETAQREGRDRAREMELARRWRDASLALSKRYPEAARMAVAKMRYWTQPELWTDRQLAKARIEIRDVSAELGRLIDPEGPPRLA